MSEHAFGKVILFGEHTVVYGRPALACGLARGVTCATAEPGDGPLRLEVPAWDLVTDSDADGLVGDALRRLRGLLPGLPDGGRVVVDATIPAAAGLGSSAALAVLLVRVRARLQGLGIEDERVRALAHAMEAVFHGSPSGLDDTTATYGGLCLYRVGGWVSRPTWAEGYEPCNERTLAVPAAAPSLVIGATGVPRSTRKMVDGVRGMRERDPRGTEALFDGVDECLQRGLAALVAGDMEALGQAMSRNQELLASLGVSSPEIGTLVGSALEAGALGAKLTGAGGGGCVIALAPGREDAVLEAWRARGFDGWVHDGLYHRSDTESTVVTKMMDNG